MTKKMILLQKIEPLILYFILFFPAVFASAGDAASQANSSYTLFFLSVPQIVIYIFFSIPQVVFIFYFVGLKNKLKEIPCAYADGVDNTDDSPMRRSCFAQVIKTVTRIFLYTVILFVAALLAGFILSKLNLITQPVSLKTDASLIPLYLFVSIVTGYREEVFFRFYLFKSLKNYADVSANGESAFLNFHTTIAAVLIISAMFSICHIAQGIAGIVISFLNSAILCFIFLKHKNIHINAFSHAFYNFTILVLAAFQKSNI